MRNKIREKIIAGILLTAFSASNISLSALAIDAYRPALRSADMATALDVGSSVRINNADSIVNLSLRDADVKQVLRMFADQASMNIIFAPSVEGTVTMDLVNITLEKALNLVVSTQNLTYDIQSNTLLVGGKDDEISIGNASKEMILLPVKYVSAASLASFLNKNIFNKKGITPGVSTKPVVTVNPATNELIIMGTRNDAMLAQRIIDQFDRKPSITSFKVNHTTPAEMAGLICSTLIPSIMTPSGAGEGGGGETGGAASIEGVPTGYASDASMSSGGGSGEGLAIGGGKLLCSVEQNANADDMDSLPFKNLTVTYFPTQGTIQVIGGSATQLDMIRDYIAENDKKSPQAYLEVQIVELSEEGSKEFSNAWQFMSKNFSFNAGGGTGFSTNSNLPIFFAGHGYTSNSKNGDMNGQVYGNRWSHSPTLVYTVNYLVENTKGRVLANPRVLLTSGQESVIDLTSDYVAKVTSQYLDSTGTGSSQVQKDYDIQDDNGIKVSITPFISPDGYVTLDIKPEYATIAGQLTTPSVVPGKEDLAATLLQRRNLDLKGVRIKDGETLVIGGLISENETKTVNKIPFLGDIPVLGMFFRSTRNQKEKQEMVIMLTPQILVDTEDAGEEVTL